MGRLEEKERAVNNQNQHYYTAREAQEKLGLSKAMFFRKVNEGLIPKVVPPGMKQGLYPRRDIDALALSMNLMFEQYDRVAFSRSTPADQVEELKIGIRCFGSDFITPLPERIAFQQKSEFTFHSLKVDGQVVGYVSLFRFPEAFLDALLTGRRIERDITIKEVLPFVRLEPFRAYIDVFVIDPDLPAHLRHLYAGIMIARFIDLVLHLLANGYQISHLHTVAPTKEADALLSKFGFRVMEGKSIAPGRVAYEYALDQAGIDELSTHSQREQGIR
jgi:predicted DNA-binding transcriptional regulator AlpA